MSVKILIAKYIPDRRRDEPRNVGVLVVGPDGPGTVRFLGQDQDGSVNGRKVPHSLIRDLDAYKLWVEYWTDAVQSGGSAVSNLAEFNTDTYYVAEAGEVHRDPQIEDIAALADLYFRELVVEAPDEPAASSADALASAVDSLITRPAISKRARIEHDYPVHIEARGRLVDLKFQYAFHNGHTTVGQRVLLADESRAFGALGRAQSLPAEYGASLAFVLADEFHTLQDSSTVLLLLEERCHVIEADAESAEDDLVAALER